MRTYDEYCEIHSSKIVEIFDQIRFVKGEAEYVASENRASTHVATIG